MARYSNYYSNNMAAAWDDYTVTLSHILVMISTLEHFHLPVLPQFYDSIIARSRPYSQFQVSSFNISTLMK